MSEHVDEETGEIRPNGNGIAMRASAAAQAAKVVLERDKVGYGSTPLHHALAKAAARMPIWVTADADNTLTRAGAKVKYATLKQILATVRPILAEHGIRVRQGAERSWAMDDGGTKGRLVPVYTDFVHEVTGEYERTMIEIPITRLDPQSMGSAITYGRRYTLTAGLALATDEADDDGASAMPRDIHAKTEDSPEVSALKAEIDKQKDIEAITKWASEPKNRSRLNRLDDAEAERVRTHYAMKREKLSTAE